MPIITHAMTSIGNAGDSQLVLAIAQNIRSEQTIELACNQSDAVVEFERSLNDTDDHVLVLSGVNGLKFLNQALKSDKVLNLLKKNKLVVSWSGHQAPVDFKQSIDNIHVVGLLQEAISFDPDLKAQLGRRLVSMEFVPGTLSEELINSGEYLTEWNKNHPDQIIPNATNGYLAAILPGDAPKRNGDHKFYEAEEARNLGIALAREAKQTNKFLLVTNGPRMGKFDPKSTDLKNPTIVNRHQKDEQLDAVSQAFIDGVHSVGISKDQFLFINFIDKDSAYAAIVTAVYQKNKQSTLVYGAESISGVETANHCDDVVAIKVSVMSDLHEAFLERMQKIYRVGVATQLDDKIDFETTPDPTFKTMYLTHNPDQDAKNIAAAINTELQLLRDVRAAKTISGTHAFDISRERTFERSSNAENTRSPTPRPER